MSNIKIRRFKNFKIFYQKSVEEVLKEHPDYIRLDGKANGSSLGVHGSFYYKGDWWDVHSDSCIEKLTQAYRQLIGGDDPFVRKPTKYNGNECLVVAGDESKTKRFYVYLHR